MLCQSQPLAAAPYRGERFSPLTLIRHQGLQATCGFAGGLYWHHGSEVASEVPWGNVLPFAKKTA